MLQTWAPATPACFDLGTVFSMNGLAPQATYKPVNGTGGTGRFPVLWPGSGGGRSNKSSYLRSGGGPYDGADSRSIYDRHGGGGGGGSSLLGPGYPPTYLAAPPPYPVRGATGGYLQEFLPVSKRGDGAAPLCSLYPRAPKGDSQQAEGGAPPKYTENRLRRRKKEENGSKADSGPADTVGKPKEEAPKFDLEEAAFPPLPGFPEEEASGQGVTPEESTAPAASAISVAASSRLSDIVRGGAGRNNEGNGLPTATTATAVVSSVPPRTPVSTVATKPPTRDCKTQTAESSLSPPASTNSAVVTAVVVNAVVAAPSTKDSATLTNGGDFPPAPLTPPTSPVSPTTTIREATAADSRGARSSTTSSTDGPTSEDAPAASVVQQPPSIVSVFCGLPWACLLSPSSVAGLS